MWLGIPELREYGQVRVISWFLAAVSTINLTGIKQETHLQALSCKTAMTSDCKTATPLIKLAPNSPFPAWWPRGGRRPADI